MVRVRLLNIPQGTRVSYWHRATLCLYKYICLQNIWLFLEKKLPFIFLFLPISQSAEADFGQPNFWPIIFDSFWKFIFSVKSDRLTVKRWSWGSETHGELDFVLFWERLGHRQKSSFESKVKYYLLLYIYTSRDIIESIKLLANFFNFSRCQTQRRKKA